VKKECKKLWFFTIQLWERISRQFCWQNCGKVKLFLENLDSQIQSIWVKIDFIEDYWGTLYDKHLV
jgi:hypothetical protein